jgi:hypothetical protein
VEDAMDDLHALELTRSERDRQFLRRRLAEL